MKEILDRIDTMLDLTSIPAPAVAPQPRPYFSKSLGLEQAASLLAQIHAAGQPTRAKTIEGARVRVYTVDGGGEAMVTEIDRAMLKVELFKGKCPC